MAATQPPAEFLRWMETRLGQGFWQYFVSKVNATLREVGEPVRITSWYRSPTGNQRESGKATSQHLIGTAIDFSDVVPGGGMPLGLRQKVVRAARANGWGFVLDEGDHIHAQLWVATPGVQGFVAYAVAYAPVSRAVIS